MKKIIKKKSKNSQDTLSIVYHGESFKIKIARADTEKNSEESDKQIIRIPIF